MNLDEKYITQKVESYFQIASNKLNMAFPEIIVKFDLKGTVSGRCDCYSGGKMILKFNIEIFKLNREKFYEVIIHEVAHGVLFQKHGLRKIKPHGKEWKRMVTEMGGVPKRCHDYKMPPSKKKKFECVCNCDTHFVSRIIYERISFGKVYRCRDCKGVLKIKEDI